MTDKDVQDEIAENQQRQVENENRDDDSLVGSVEKAVNPITNALIPDAVDDDVTSQSELNDAEQRPD
ncbi:MAG: hypothetical protein M3490_10855 [Chloroflexota bacterium]|nr:hypothetical protein [Chloroflexota bacterium]